MKYTQIALGQDANGQPMAAKTGTYEAHCMADWVSWFSPERIVLTIEPVPNLNQDMQAIRTMSLLAWWCKGRGLTPIATASGLRAGHFVTLRVEEWERLNKSLELTAEMAVSYLGLLFSSLRSLSKFLMTEGGPAEEQDGQDGCCTIETENKEFWGQVRQVRGLTLENDEIVGVWKGTVRYVPKGSAGGPHHPGSSMLKLGHGKGKTLWGWTPARQFLGDVDVTWQAAQQVAFCNVTRKVVRKQVRGRTRAILTTLNSKSREGVLERLGVLKYEKVGEQKVFCEPARNVLSALTSKLPWSEELEQRLGRVFVSELMDGIAPSCGFTAKGVFLQMSDSLGESPCSWEEAKGVVTRAPISSWSNIVPVRNPGKIARTGLVTSEIATRVDGDADGDYILVISGQFFELLRDYGRTDFVAGNKPPKVRLASPATRENIIRVLALAYATTGNVGRATNLAHHLLVDGQVPAACRAAAIARDAPMEQGKWAFSPSLTVRLGELLKEVSPPKVPIWWKKYCKQAEAADTPRDLAAIEELPVVSLIDEAYREVLREVRRWAKKSAPRLFTTRDFARIVTRSTHRASVTEAMMVADAWDAWKSYWAGWYRLPGDERGKSFTMYDEMESRGRKLSVGGLQLALRTATSFPALWHLIGKRWGAAVGYHHSVVAWAERWGVKLEDEL